MKVSDPTRPRLLRDRAHNVGEEARGDELGVPHEATAGSVHPPVEPDFLNVVPYMSMMAIADGFQKSVLFEDLDHGSANFRVRKRRDEPGYDPDPPGWLAETLCWRYLCIRHRYQWIS